MIYLLLLEAEWLERLQGGGNAAEPGEEGFVHCCDEGQMGFVRRCYFSAEEDVVAVRLDPTHLAAETRYEPGSGGERERFAHV